jgi:hypothetical protein
LQHIRIRYRGADTFTAGNIRCDLREPSRRGRLKLRNAKGFHLRKCRFTDIPKREGLGFKHAFDLLASGDKSGFDSLKNTHR